MRDRAVAAEAATAYAVAPLTATKAWTQANACVMGLGAFGFCVAI